MAVRANTGQSPNYVSMLGERLIRLTSIKPAMGCDAGSTLNRYRVGRPTFCVRGTSYRCVVILWKEKVYTMKIYLTPWFFQ